MLTDQYVYIFADYFCARYVLVRVAYVVYTLLAESQLLNVPHRYHFSEPNPLEHGRGLVLTQSGLDWQSNTIRLSPTRVAAHCICIYSSRCTAVDVSKGHARQSNTGARCDHHSEQQLHHELLTNFVL